ncbi:unnamed protein product [Auanema sp. JU1783]|nr:unnamed protein product [Auanema sp. JU1783]
MSEHHLLKTLGKKIGLEVFRINKFELERVPQEQHGAFYSGDCYVVLSTKSTDEWNVHFWLGNHATSDEIGSAAIWTVEVDNALGGFPVQYREVQHHESSLFLSYFPDGLRYLEGGYASGYHHCENIFDNWKPKLFHCKGKRNIRCAQVKCAKESLNLGDVFILDLGRNLYVWMPPDSGRLERIKGMARAKNIALVERHGEADVHILDDEWKTDVKFWSYFGGKEVIPKIAKAKDDDDDYWKIHTKLLSLWKVSDATGDMKVTIVAEGELKQSLLDSNDAFILDASAGGIFVWIGKNCTIEERHKAVSWGDKYLKQRKLPEWTQVTRILETTEPQIFTQWFSQWADVKKKNSFEPHLYQVSDESGKIVVEEVSNFTQESLDGDDVMILDALNLIYVWVGSGATPNEKKSAEQTAKKFLEQSQLPRHKKANTETIYQGQETPTFKKFFPSWDEKLFKAQARSVQNMRKLLFH